MRVRRGLRILAGVGFGAVLSLVPVCPAAADLGPHALNPADDNHCKICHDTASGTPNLHAGSDYRPFPPGFSAQIPSVICYLCHVVGGGGPGGRPMWRQTTGGAHGLKVGTISTPDSWMGGERSRKESYEQTGLPYTRDSRVIHKLECATCHNVHNDSRRPFLQRPSIETLCRACHPGRTNQGLLGSANGVESRTGYSTHPTGVAVEDLPYNGPGEFGEVDRRLRVAVGSYDATKDPWVLGGHLVVPTSDDAVATPFSCQTCHAVHGSFERPGEHGPALEAIYEPGNPSALCEGCHRIRSGHPTRGVAGSPFRPSSFVTAQGIPEAWGAEKHLDRGATPFDPKADFPECSSCHDLHGGLRGTSLLYGPNTAEDGKGNWCFNCHPARALVPADHPPLPGIGNDDTKNRCTKCHFRGGRARPLELKAHGRFDRALVPAGHPSFDEDGIKDWERYCGTCHDEKKARRLTWRAHRGFDW